MMVKDGLDRFISHEIEEHTIILIDTILCYGNAFVNRGKLEFKRGFNHHLQGFQLF